MKVLRNLPVRWTLVAITMVTTMVTLAVAGAVLLYQDSAMIREDIAIEVATLAEVIGRNSTAEEQGWPLAFLNSDAASYITGENL